jgi:hypothetical protein
MIIRKHPASQKQIADTVQHHQKKKWAIFAYIRNETRKITKSFNDTNKNSIQKAKHNTKQ